MRKEPTTKKTTHTDDHIAFALKQADTGTPVAEAIRRMGISEQAGPFGWHDAPARQFVITLDGTLDFQTRRGAHFVIRPGDILLAEDTAGSGHRWKLVGDQPCRLTTRSSVSLLNIAIQPANCINNESGPRVDAD